LSCDAAEPVEPSGYGPHLRFDEAVACRERGCDPMSPVPHYADVAGSCDPDRRRLATLLEPAAILLDRRRAQAAKRAPAHRDLGE